MKTNRFALAIMVLMCFSLAAGCGSILVESYPPDAKILIDGVAREERTPHKYSVRDFGTGYHTVSVEKEGYKKTASMGFKIGISVGDIVWSVLPPVFLKNLFHNRWKDVSSDLRPFELIEAEKQEQQLLKEGSGTNPGAGR